VSIFTLAVPPLSADNSIGFRFGFNYLTGDREDTFTTDGLYYYEAWYTPYIDSSFQGRTGMNASDVFLGGELNVAFPLHRKLSFSPCVEYFSHTADYDISSMLFWRDPPDAPSGSVLILSSDEVDYALLSIMFNVKYAIFEEGEHRLLPYIGGGIGIHRWSIEMERHSIGSWVHYGDQEYARHGSYSFFDAFENDGTSFGAQILGGIGFNLNSFLEPFVEFQCRFIQKAGAELLVEHEELPPMHTLNNEIFTADFSGLQFAAGLRLKF
jgi:hypothetical protein